MAKLIAVKVLQDWPITHNSKDYKKGETFEIDEASAKWLIDNKRVEVFGLKSSETSNNETGAPAPAQADREAKIYDAVKKLYEAEPSMVPSADKVKAETGIRDVKAAERDAALEKVKAELAESKPANNKGNEDEGE